MALIWSHTIDDRTYEVRSAGATRRLYTNGAFHSQYNPNQPVTGNVWDLLFLPSMFAPRGSIKRVLMLGVGGGAVINQLNHFIKPDEIIGIELDPVHIKVAKEFFGLRQKNVTIICDDARAWLEEYQGEPFDLIIDDIFIDGIAEPYRPVFADVQWFESLTNHLGNSGAVVFNFGDEHELQSSGYFEDKRITKNFLSAFRLITPLYENVIGAFHRRYHEISELKRNIRQINELNEDRADCRLSYAISRIDR